MEGAVKGLILAAMFLAVVIVTACSSDGVDKATPSVPEEPVPNSGSCSYIIRTNAYGPTSHSNTDS